MNDEYPAVRNRGEVVVRWNDEAGTLELYSAANKEWYAISPEEVVPICKSWASVMRTPLRIEPTESAR